MKCTVCDDSGWICANHPDKPFQRQARLRLRWRGRAVSAVQMRATGRGSEGLQNRIRLKGLASLKPTKERAFRQNGRDRAKVDEAVRDGVRLGPLCPAGY